jgi:hypothetical protein
MTYQQDLQLYVDHVNRLWNEIQNLNLTGLPPAAIEQIREFQRQNDTERSRINQQQPELLALYAIADQASRVQMEQQLRDLQAGLDNTERIYRASNP